VSACHLAELDSSLSIVINNISSNIRFALLTNCVNSVSATRGNSILPNVGNTSGILVVTSNFDTIFMGFLNKVFHNVGFIVLNLDSRVVKAQLVLHDLIVTTVRTI
jgi:hypothetical protein